MNFQMTNDEFRMANRKCAAFTLIEIMVVVVLLSLIVLALMAVFNSTQKAFRASVTQTDVLEGGRAAMDLMAQDVREMSPSFGQSNRFTGAVNFYTGVNPENTMIQPLVASAAQRTNVLESFFVLTHENWNWRGVGYAVVTNSADGLYSLYRFEFPTNAARVQNPAYIFTNEFQRFLFAPTNYSHLMDGVVHLTVRAYDRNGVWMTNNVLYYGGATNYNRNVFYFAPQWGEVGFEMFSNTLPASVEIEMGVVENQALRRAEVLGGGWLTNQAGAVHVFRQRVQIPSVDPSAYQ
jgi:prepilin-type N-terminal cleavage/methylation domain-containing protein